MSGGGLQGLALIAHLRVLPDVRILIVDSIDENIGRYLADGFFHVPALADRQAFESSLLKICEQESVGDVFACTSHELRTLDGLRAQLHSRDITLHVCLPGALSLGEDKLLLYRWAKEKGFDCLPFYENVSEAPHGESLIGKRRSAWGGRDICKWVVGDGPCPISEVESLNFVWQHRLLAFEEYSLDFAVDGAGNISDLAFRRRIRTVGGFAILCETGAPDFVRRLGEKIALCLSAEGARGPLNLQIITDGRQIGLTDFNPRPGTSSPMSLSAGLNMLGFLLGSPEPAEKLNPHRTLRVLHDIAVRRLGLHLARGLVFDLDDTLLDQKRWMLGKLELTWEAMQRSLPAKKKFLAHCLYLIEEGNRGNLFDVLCIELELKDHIRTQLIDQYRRAVPNNRVLYNDSLACLAQLRRHGYRLGLLSDNPSASQRQKLLATGLENAIDAVVLTNDLQSCKPARICFTLVAERMGLAVDQLVMVGDNLFRDVSGAIDAGYLHAFHLQRHGSFFNFHAQLWGQFVTREVNWTPITALHELHWHLPNQHLGQ